LPLIQLPNVIDAVVVFDLQHSTFGQSVSSAHGTKLPQQRRKLHAR
jgi:hypothetical protein